MSNTGLFKIKEETELTLIMSNTGLFKIQEETELTLLLCQI